MEGREARSSAFLSASVVSLVVGTTLEAFPGLTRKIRPRRTGPGNIAAAKRTHLPYVPGGSRRSFAASSDSGGSPRAYTSPGMGGLQTSRSGVLSAPSPYQFQLVLVLFVLLLLF